MSRNRYSIRELLLLTLAAGFVFAVDHAIGEPVFLVLSIGGLVPLAMINSAYRSGLRSAGIDPDNPPQQPLGGVTLAMLIFFLAVIAFKLLYDAAGAINAFY